MSPWSHGESWFGVEYTASAVPSQTSQLQPLPKRFTPPSISAAFSWSKPSNVASIASASAPPGGAPPPSGLMICQNSVWFAWPPALLRTAVRFSSGISSRSASTCSTGRSAHSVPASAAFALSTYALWWASWWIRIVASSMCGSSAS